MEKIIELKNVSKKYKDNYALNDVSVYFEKGKIYGIIGPNGAGKTSLFKAITGLIHPDSGEIILFENEKEKMESRKEFGVLIEKPYIDENLTAVQNLRMLEILFGKPKGCSSKLIEIMGLKKCENKVKTYSLGMKQRLGIAMSLVNDPSILILDEPLNGLDPRGMLELRTLLLRYCQEKQMTIILSSHLLYETDIIADVFVFMKSGKVIDIKSKKAIHEKDADIESYFIEKIKYEE